MLRICSRLLAPARSSLQATRWLSAAADSKKTCLFSVHERNQAKLVDYSGFLMPIQYANLSIIDSHQHTRTKASLFDVSHMLQTKIHGRDRIEFIESLTVADVQALNEDQSALTLFTNHEGGIIDDLIVTKTGQEYLYVVSNAGCRGKDQQLLNDKLEQFKGKGKDVQLEYIDDHALVALQGPLAASVLQSHVSYELNQQKFMTTRLATLSGVANCRITRCGYTGEDGFEISIPANKAASIVEELLGNSNGNLQLAGLGARDTLRLEAGLCLYGNDIDEKISPVEAGLVWTIGKRRRAECNFPGAVRILQQIKDKPNRKRVGLLGISAGPPPRKGYTIWNGDDKTTQLGQVSSGCWSPTLKKNISMAYVEAGSSKVATRLSVEARGKLHSYEIVKMPFVPARYFV